MLAKPEAACKHAQFPDEILDEIIQAVGPRRHCSHRRRNHVDLEPERRNWSNCSLVCRRWYQITLPYMFRRILITDLHLTKDSADGDDPFLLFLSERPYIAQLIRNVTFDFGMSTAVPLPMDIVLPAIQLLPRLRYLSVFKYSPSLPSPIGDIDITHREDSEQLDFGDYKIERLDYCTVTVPKNHYLTIAELIGRFSEIGTLYVKVPLGLRDPYSTANVCDAVAVASKTYWKLQKIHELHIEAQHIPSPFYLSLLPELSVLRHLTCLSFNCAPSYGLEDLNQLLCIVGPTLGEFYLTVSWGWFDEAQVGDSSAPFGM
ncbi:hypothetical protein BC835DRAFT_646496 [Cytidiella melzeri]|nr:hypothetical protein BC835DRAFT_646496 [Cytidiella melzeri]